MTFNLRCNFLKMISFKKKVIPGRITPMRCEHHKSTEPHFLECVSHEGFAQLFPTKITDLTFPSHETNRARSDNLNLIIKTVAGKAPTSSLNHRIALPYLELIYQSGSPTVLDEFKEVGGDCGGGCRGSCKGNRNNPLGCKKPLSLEQGRPEKASPIQAENGRRHHLSSN